jgi:hypothetical protein
VNSRRLNSVVLISLALALMVSVVLFCTIQPLEGTYCGDLLNPLGSETSLVLKEGKVEIVPAGHPPNVVGDYFKKDDHWYIKTQSDVWELKTFPFGFTMINTTNANVTYTMRKRFFGF